MFAGEAQAQSHEVPAYAAEQFLETLRITGVSFSADGETILFTSDASGVFNAHAVAFVGGEPQQLTHGVDPVDVHGYFPSDDRILYSSDRDGNELTHIYVRNADQSVRDLTLGEDVRSIFLGWTDDKRSFFFASNDRDPRSMDVYEMTVEDFQRTLLYRNERGGRIGAISPDRRYLAMAVLNSNSNIDLLLYDRTLALLYLTDHGSEFKYLKRFDLTTGEHTTVLQLPWDVMHASLSPKGRYLIVQVNNARVY